MKPRAPSHTVVRISSWTFVLARLPKSRIGMRIEIRMMMPPIVGVPFFCNCPSRPRSRMVSPICFFWSFAMIFLPTHIETRMARTAQVMARNEM